MKNFFLINFLIFLTVFIFCDDNDFKMVPQDVNQGYALKIVFNKDGSMFATASMTNNAVKVWSIKGKLLKLFILDSQLSMPEMSFSNDNKYLALSNFQNITIWNLETNKKAVIQNNLEKMSYRNFNTVVFSKDNTQILAGISIPAETKNRIDVWNVDGKFIKTFAEYKTDVSTMIKNILINPANDNVITFGTDNIIKIWDSNATLINTMQGDNPYYLANINLSNDGKYIGWLGMGGLKILNFNGTILVSNKNNLAIGDFKIDDKFFIEVGTKGTSENYYFVLRQRDFNNNIILETEKLPYPSFIKLSPDGKHLVAGCIDGTINIINLKSGNIVTLINNNDSEWLEYTQDGYWDASTGGDKLIAMVKDMDAYSVDQFAAKFNRPDIILKRLGFGNDPEINYYQNLYLNRLKKLGIKEEDLLKEIHVPTSKIVNAEQDDKFMNLSFELSDSKFKLIRYNIFVNEVPLFGTGKEISGGSMALKEKIELTTGANKIEVSCMNEKGAESFRAVTNANYNKETKSDLYFIGFGISKFKNNELNLKYADKDAEDLESLLKKAKGNYSNVISKIYLNEDVTLENIKSAKEILKNSKVDDVLILFIAGHGIHDNDSNATYYFITYDTDINNLKSRACSFEIIENILQEIPPRKKLFLMDTCESGELDKGTENNFYNVALASNINARSIRVVRSVSSSDKKDAVSNPRTYLFEKDRYIYNDLFRRSGSIVFSSSRGNEFSYEKDEYKNGLFTKAIMDSLTKKSTEKNYISNEELRVSVTDEVSKISGNLQHPTVDRDNKFQKINLSIIKK